MRRRSPSEEQLPATTGPVTSAANQCHLTTATVLMSFHNDNSHKCIDAPFGGKQEVIFWDMLGHVRSVHGPVCLERSFEMEQPCRTDCCGLQRQPLKDAEAELGRGTRLDGRS